MLDGKGKGKREKGEKSKNDKGKGKGKGASKAMANKDGRRAPSLGARRGSQAGGKDAPRGGRAQRGHA